MAVVSYNIAHGKHMVHSACTECKAQYRVSSWSRNNIWHFESSTDLDASSTCSLDFILGMSSYLTLCITTPTGTNNNYTCKKRLQSAGSPAMDHNGFVSSPPLYHQHLLNDCHDGRRGGAQTLRSPAGHLEMSHFVLLARLQEDMYVHSLLI